MLEIPGLYDEKELILGVIKDLSIPCFDCRLGHCQKPNQNRGLVWRGNPNAAIALVSIMPGPKEMETGRPLTGPSGVECDKWFATINLDTNKDMFVTNVTQCKPPEAEDGSGQRSPYPDELAACFPDRCLRLLRAMPNLEIVITLGWDAAGCLLGGGAKEASHMGHWFSTTLLPNKAVFCLPHPAGLLRDAKGGATPAFLEKKYKIMKCLDKLKRAYLDTDKVVNLVKAQ